MKRIRAFLTAFLSLIFLGAWTGCGEVTLIDDSEPDQTTTPDEETLRSDTLIVMNDTAKFYLSGMEIHDIMLSYSPTPSTLIKDSRYRMPTKLEISQVLKNVDVPKGYWKSKQRILCYDHPKDEGLKIGSIIFGLGGYYTYTPHGSVTKAGFQTMYCILPIRTERINKTTEHTVIGVNDKWND